MIEIQRIKENKSEVIEGLNKRGIQCEKEIDNILEIDQNWRNAKTELQDVSTKINATSKDIGRFFSTGDKEQAHVLKTQSVDLKKEEASLKAKVEDLQS